MSLPSHNMIPLIKSVSSTFPSVTMKPLPSSSFLLSTWRGHHQSSVCQNETAIIGLPSVNNRQLSSALPLSRWDNYPQPSPCQHETTIISLPSVNMRQLSSAFPLSTRDGYHQSSLYQHDITNKIKTFRVCRSVHFHTFKWINQLDAAINYRFIVYR